MGASGPGGRLLFGIIATIAEFERNLIHERILAARQSSIDHGGSFGRPRKLGAGSAQEIERLRVAGLSMSRVASAMGGEPVDAVPVPGRPAEEGGEVTPGGG